MMAVISSEDLFLFSLALFFVFLLLLTYFLFGLWVNRTRIGYSPYTGKPLRSGRDLHWMTVEKVLRYLYSLNQYENQIFNLHRAAVCRETGRIFQDCVTWYDSIKLDWSFIEKRYPGKYVSWGSLTPEQQQLVREKHESLEGFQTEFSSPTYSPRKIEPQYVYTRPGPLYVDIDTGILLGWKNVPDTDLEVLIVQKPVKRHILRIDE